MVAFQAVAHVFAVRSQATRVVFGSMMQVQVTTPQVRIRVAFGRSLVDRPWRLSFPIDLAAKNVSAHLWRFLVSWHACTQLVFQVQWPNPSHVSKGMLMPAPATMISLRGCLARPVLEFQAIEHANFDTFPSTCRTIQDMPIPCRIIHACEEADQMFAS